MLARMWLLRERVPASGTTDDEPATRRWSYCGHEAHLDTMVGGGAWQTRGVADLSLMSPSTHSTSQPLTHRRRA